MSANNFLKISKDPIEGFIIQDCDADTGECMRPFDSSEDLQDAIKKANKYMEDEIVEYGLRFSLDNES